MKDLWSAPEDVNPYLWQHELTNHIAGIFSLSGKELVMAGGVDIASILFVKSKTGWIAVDTALRSRVQDTAQSWQSRQ